MKNSSAGVFVISAPSGAGKTTVIKKFLSGHRHDFEVSVSVTTRQPRKGEEEGKDYFFYTKEKFLSGINKGLFLEHAKVVGNYYGTLKSTVMGILKKGKNVIMDVDVQGAENIKKALKNKAVTIFIMPPSFEELKKRLYNRKTDARDVIARRLKLAKKELKARSKYDYIVINKDVAEAGAFLDCILKLEQFKSYRI